MYNIIVGTINQLPRQPVVGVIEKYKEYYALLGIIVVRSI